MLKKMKNTDIDTIMNLWKKEYIANNKKVCSEVLTIKYTEIENHLLDKNSTTILYTEDDIIEGFISINKNKKIKLIYVDRNIRHEGIGSMLIDSVKKIFDKLYIDMNEKNKKYELFFLKNDFKKNKDKLDDEKTKEIYEWTNDKIEKANVIYFDNDIDENIIQDDSKFKLNFIKIPVRNILKNNEIKDIKTYIKIRKEIEKAFKSKKVLLYINYNNYYDQLDDLIKEIAKIEKSKFEIVVSEPLAIENYKKGNFINEIKQSYNRYKIHIVDIISDLKQDISINKILKEKIKILIRNMEKISENM